MILGDTFFYHPQVDRHLWIVLSDPKQFPEDDIVVVSVTTYREGKDCSCFLNPGDHPSIVHRSVVYYQKADVVTPKQMAALEGGYISTSARLPQRTLQRIHRGAEASEFTPLKCLEVLRKHGLISG